MHCRHCGARTRVVATIHRDNGTHRWLRCLECDASTRTLETFYMNRKPGPVPGQPKRGGIARGSTNGASVLTEDDVLRLRHLAAAGTPHKNLASEYGIALATVSRIVNRKLWSHVA
jgi:hypothetical protein